MYSSPVADSIERVRAVCTAAHDTISGKISPTIRRSQTNSAHGPTSEANGATSAGPAPVPIHAHEQHDLDDDDDQQDARQQDERRLGQLRRHQVPVAQDHRREDAADRRADDGQLDEQRGRRRAIRRPRPARRTRASRPRPPARPLDDSGEIAGRRPAGDQRRRRERRRTRAAPARRGASQAGSTTTGESPSVAGRAPSEITARTPNPRAQIAVKRR